MADLDELDRIHAAAWEGPWTAETWEVECDIDDTCPSGNDCDGSHDCETILAPEAYPSPPGQCVVQTSHADGRIMAVGLEQFAAANTAAIVALHNAWPEVSARLRAAEALLAAITPRPRAEWHEDFGPVLWWRFPIEEPPYAGWPTEDDFPDYVTHWTKILVPEEP